MTRAKNPRPTLPRWRLSAPLPELPVADAEADAPVAEAEPPVVVATLLPKAKVPVVEALLPPVWLVGAAVAEAVKKLELMHDAWQSAYCCVSIAEPLPCGHAAAHSVVAFACNCDGHGTPTHLA